MVIVIFGDIVGSTGRKAVQAALPDIRARHSPDLVLGNAENLAGGRGVNRKTFREMMDMGFDGLTSGNHIWDNREVFSIIDQEPRLLRPANYPSPANDPCPGRGFGYIGTGRDRVFVINLLGRVFMDDVDCPFATVDRILEQEKPTGPILVDMHCDATSEKYAMGWYLAGRVTAVTGTHSHVQTADERVLPGGTAYITDIGMSGSFDSVIGIEPEGVLKRIRTRRPAPFEQASGNPGVGFVVLRLSGTGRAESIERERYSIPVNEWGGDDL